MNFLRNTGILGRNADRAGIEMALPHHDAAFDDKRRGRKPIFFRAQEGRNGHISPGLHLAVGFDPDTAAQIVEHERLMRFRQPKFPRDAGILDGGERRGAGSAGITADQHLIRMGLRHPGRDGPDPDFRHQLHRNGRIGLAFFKSKMSCARSSIE